VRAGRQESGCQKRRGEVVPCAERRMSMRSYVRRGDTARSRCKKRTWTKACVPQASEEWQSRSVRGGQSDDRMRPWLADTNWRTLRRDAAAYHASRVPFLLISIHCFDPHIAKSYRQRVLYNLFITPVHYRHMFEFNRPRSCRLAHLLSLSLIRCCHPLIYPGYYIPRHF
jgi:hypothetical protein